MEIIDKVCSTIILIGGIFMFHKSLYLIFGLFCRAKKYPHSDHLYKYAVVIAARNEEKVVGNLIESIRKQTYPGDHIEIFVVADNCRDHTADLCRSLGAIVYERFDTRKARKGYALEFLFSRIEQDYGIDHVDGYFIFDADNLLHPRFIEEMNNVFATGAEIITSYRNTKNFDTNPISSAYGIHFYNNSMAMHRPRSVLGIGTHLTGTGYLIRNTLLHGGWHYTTFTEDDQITMATAGMGYKVAYCEAAEFFDEQPCDFKTVFRQRVRWAKGRLTNFFKYGHKAFAGIFKYRSWTCYDMFTHYFPYGLFSWVIALVYPAVTFISDLLLPGPYDYGGMALNILASLGTTYLYSLLSGACTVIREYKHIRCRLPKLILYIFTYPWFNMISIPVYIIAIFKRVQWTPIIHDDDRKIESLVS
jgi:cellulose synthase/poly-beta-1,6-N-acetylglucosamine synthase-like glycosyltransferase